MESIGKWDPISAHSEWLSPDSMLSVTRALNGLLRGIKENGGHADSDSVWGYYMMYYNKSYANSHLSSVRRSTLTATHTALSYLAELAQRQIDSLDEMSRQEGISQQSTLMALPDELLQMIFSSIKQEKNESTFALLQVNRRFRRIAFDTPSLWTQICNLQPRAYITAFARCAARSLDTARSLCFCERSAEKLRLLAARSDDIYVNLSDFISLLSSINHHWDEIRFHSCDSGDFEQLIETDYVPASVKKIEMSGWNCLRSLEEFEDFFDMKWAHTASIVFKGFNTVSWIMASALKTVDLTFDASEPRSMANIILVLSELKTTENLAMTWKEIRKERLADDRGVLEVFELPSVKSLRVQVLGGDHIICSNSVNFAKLFSNMDFPALRKLSILTNFTPVLTGNQLLRELVLRHGDPAGDGIGLPLLRSFSLRMQDGPYDLDGFEDLKNDLLCHMPGLERLYIEGPGIAAMSRDCLPVLTWNMDPTNDGVKLFPRMKSMVFDSWLRVDCWLLQGIRDDVFADTHSGRPPAGFERLVVARCPLVTDPLIVDSTYFIDFGKTLIIKDKCEDADFDEFEFKDSDIDAEESETSS